MIDVDEATIYVEADVDEALVKFACEHSLRLCRTAVHCSAQLQGEIIGMASAIVNEQTGTANILVIYVVPVLRGLRIGSKLLNAVTLLCRDRMPSSFDGEFRVVLKCDSLNADTDRFNRFLDRGGWPTLKYDSSTLVMDMKKVPECRFYKMGLIDEVAQLGSLKFRFMSDMSDEEIDEALHQADSIAPHFLQPAKNMKTLIPKLSCFVFDDDMVVAWASMLRLSETEIYAECIYVKEEYRENNLAYLILYRVMNHSVAECPYVRRVHVGFDETDVKLARFYRRIFEGCIVGDYKTFVSIKTIK